jgi:hypothetical protein
MTNRPGTPAALGRHREVIVRSFLSVLLAAAIAGGLFDSRAVIAEEVPDAAAGARPREQRLTTAVLAERAQQAHQLKLGGMVLTGIGIASAILIPTALAVWMIDPGHSDGNLVFGVYGSIAGAAGAALGLGLGIPMWVVGERREADANGQRGYLAFAPILDDHRVAGGAVRWSLQF